MERKREKEGIRRESRKRLIGGRDHRKVRRERERRRGSHAKRSSRGRKRRGMEEEKKEEKKRKGGYYGYRVTVKGTLNGGRRTRTYERQKGTVPGGTKRARVRMGEEVAKTTVGTRGVRVEYCYGRG